MSGGDCVCVCVCGGGGPSPPRARAPAPTSHAAPPSPIFFPPPHIVGGRVVKAQHHVRRVAVPVGDDQGLDGGAAGGELHGHAGGVLEGGRPLERGRLRPGGGGEEREKKRGKGSERMSARVCAWGRRDLGQPGRPHRGRTGGREAVPPHGAAPSTRGTGSKGRPARLASTKSHGGPNRPMGFVSRRRGRGPFPPIPAPVPPPALGRRQVGCTYRADEGEQEEVAHGVVADVERKR